MENTNFVWNLRFIVGFFGFDIICESSYLIATCLAQGQIRASRIYTCGRIVFLSWSRGVRSSYSFENNIKYLHKTWKLFSLKCMGDPHNGIKGTEGINRLLVKYASYKFTFASYKCVCRTLIIASNFLPSFITTEPSIHNINICEPSPDPNTHTIKGGGFLVSRNWTLGGGSLTVGKQIEFEYNEIVLLS